MARPEWQSRELKPVRIMVALAAMWETQVRSLDQEDLLEKEMASHSSTLAWEIPWIEESCRVQSLGLQSQTGLST